MRERVDLTVGHGGGEGVDERGDGLHGGIGVTERIQQPVHIHVGVPVERGGVELDVADHGGARVAFLVAVLLDVVHGGEVVRIEVNPLHADGVGHLCGRVHVQIRVIGDHAAEQGDVDGAVVLQDTLDALLHVLVLEEVLDAAGGDGLLADGRQVVVLV